ncbi:D-beta-hydroxybutyrate dehydrogenase, mitochondrial [Rhipicephalus sanguineus]|uniref:D-beta-hydroxybutyrate dehydrogenase, mitochondrial n=1 Tax=Rhipicephalus sanguineus TaxID=34632 RepID=UPI00189589E9|nr:D-beta-hydroxybutyrate dehydrogenase, mitochondrial [Rhipicephalus sanguineus]
MSLFCLRRAKTATVCPISSPWVLFSVFLFLLWNFWDYLTPLHLISVIVGSVWVALKLSYTLSQFVWRRTFVTEVEGDGRAVLITGCDSGFGHGLAKRLAHKGFLVFAGCLNTKSDGAQELSLLKNIIVLQMDVTKQEQVDDAFLAVKEKLGTRVLWSVVANAGIGSSGLLEWTTMETMKKMFDVNVFGVLRVIKRFLPLLRKSHGRVVTVASPIGRLAAPMVAPYCMTKIAVISMMDSFRRESRGRGVDFVTVEPAAYKTPIVWMFVDSKEHVTREFRKQSPEVIADYSQEDVDDWLKVTDKFSGPMIRKNPEECVDVLEKAVRETQPTTHYRSPWGTDFLLLSTILSLPSEVADIAVEIIRKVNLKIM